MSDFVQIVPFSYSMSEIRLVYIYVCLCSTYLYGIVMERYMLSCVRQFKHSLSSLFFSPYVLKLEERSRLLDHHMS